MQGQKRSALALITGYFRLPGQTAVEFANQDIKPLTQEDRLQLASAIAKEQGLGQDDCDFTFVAY